MQSRAAGVVRRKIASWRLWFKVPVFVRSSGIKSYLQHPFKIQVQALLQVRSFAFAMVGACHLGSWNLYVHKFMDFYTADPGEHFRFPTVQEAEQADRQAVREVFSLCFAGSTLDDALNTVAFERDMLRHLLLPRPKLPKAIKVEREPLKRKPGKRHADGEMDEDANGECFAWRKAECKRTRCRFNHACATCGASDHHLGVCPRKDKGQSKKGRKAR